MLKRVFMIAVLLCFSLSVVQPATANDHVKTELNEFIVLSVNSSKVLVYGNLGRIDENDTEAVPFIENGYTLVPLRFISEQLGATVSWYPDIKEIAIDYNGNKASMILGDSKFYLNNQEITMNIPSKAVNGKTYLPLRSVVEDLFQKNVYYNNGIIVISDEPVTISEHLWSEFEKNLQPRIVYTGGLELLYVYSDGTSMKKDLGYSNLIKMRGLISTMDAKDGHFYIVDRNYTETMIHKMNVDGNNTKTINLASDERIHFILAKDGQQYYYADGNIVRISDDDEASVRTIIGPGYLSKEGTYIRDGQIWFTDSSEEYAIYRLHEGKKTKISNDRSFLKHVLDHWIYYNFYENNRWSLYRMTLDGSNKTKLSADADIQHSFIANNKIYYIDQLSKTVSAMNLDGSGKKVIGKLGRRGVEIFAVQGGFVYYTEDDQSKTWTQTLYKVNIANGTKTQLANIPLDYDYGWVRIKNVRLLGENVHFSVGNQAFSVKSDGSDLKDHGRIHSGSNGILSLED